MNHLDVGCEFARKTRCCAPFQRFLHGAHFQRFFSHPLLPHTSCTTDNGIPGLGLINNIVQRYFDVYFPRAISVAQALRAHNGTERLIYTTHGWLAHMYLHCPTNFTLSGIPLVCPSADGVQAFKDAAARGDITWHAAAFNTEYENAFNEEMIAVQFQLSFDLADELGLPRPRTVSLRDVPGTTRALVPLLVKNNISALSIGVNGGSPAPDMPNPGVWADPASGTSVLYMQTGQGQGYPNNPGGYLIRICCVQTATPHPPPPPPPPLPRFQARIQ
jgi:hypothetical protein